jgi:hypothetical protein
VTGRPWRPDPLVVFLLAGGLLFAAYAFFAASAKHPIRLTAETRQALIDDFETATGRSAMAADIDRLERDYVTEELLFRSALDVGLHLSDGEIRALIVQKMRLQVTGMLPDPSDEELVNYYADNQARYWSEPGFTFRQVFFQAAPADPAGVLVSLAAGKTVAGDIFRQGAAFPAYGRSIIRSIFGQPFLDALGQAPLERWQGPIETRHGVHFILVTARHAPALLPFDVARSQVENDYLMELIQAAVARHVESLEQDHVVEIAR